jgi:hypothetical protein
MPEDMQIFHTIFNRPESHLYWENYIEYGRINTEIPQALASRWADALDFLRTQLDDGFLRAMNHSHPFANLITTLSPWHIARTIRYADILRNLQRHDPGYPAFLKKLRSPVDAKNEMMDFLRVAEIFHGAGLTTRFPEPFPDQKNPDFHILDSDNGQMVLGEISRVDNSGARFEQTHSYKQLAPLIRRCLRNPVYSARQLSVPPAGYANALPPILDRLQDQAEAWQEHAKFEDDYVEIDVFPLDEFDAFNNWLQENNRRKGFNGMPLNFNDIGRISDKKIKTEAEHFAPSQPALIILPVTLFHFMHQDAGEAIRVFKRRLMEYPNIIGIYLYAEIIESEASFSSDKGYTRKQIDGPLTQYSLFVDNDVAMPIEAGIRQKLLSALR